MTYSIDLAKQRFSLWAACRAAQVGSAQAKRKELIRALKKCGVVEFLDQCRDDPIIAEAYDKAFDEWVANVRSTLETDYGKLVSYGIAAKLFSTYTKSALVLRGCETSQLARRAHPPIDSILLKSVDKAKGTNLDAEYKWQSLDRTRGRSAILADRRALGAMTRVRSNPSLQGTSNSGVAAVGRPLSFGVSRRPA
jgi:hypothetical protein